MHVCVFCKCIYNWRAQWKKGITVFDDSKRSKVNKAFSLWSKLLWLKFNSWICVLLKSSLVIFLDTKMLLLTFDLLGLSKTVIPFFHWALQFLWHSQCLNRAHSRSKAALLSTSARSTDNLTSCVPNLSFKRYCRTSQMKPQFICSICSSDKKWIVGMYQ